MEGKKVWKIWKKPELEILKERLEKLNARRRELAEALRENPQDDFTKYDLGNVNREINNIHAQLAGASNEQEQPFVR